MNCLRCDCEQFDIKSDAVIEQEFKGELLKVTTPAMVCSKCGWTTVAPDELDELRKNTADAYRLKHGLLTSVQIKAFRKLLNKSQREFAAFLEVGEASVKRWETWLVQEKGNDRLIRMKCETALAGLLQTNAASWVFSTPCTQTFVQNPNGITIRCETPRTVRLPMIHLSPSRSAQFELGYDLTDEDVPLAA
jgi:putative zinc finger/helix-turn-helix YgiT family protein